MSDIIINGTTYEGVENITTQTTDGGTATFSEGGKTKYQHAIFLNSNTFKIGFIVTTDSETPFTFSTLKTYLKDTGIIVHCTGAGNLSQNTLSIFCFVMYDSEYNNVVAKEITYGLSNNSLSHGVTNIGFENPSVTDTVKEITG